jgi:hypothetical protein
MGWIGLGFGATETNVTNQAHRHQRRDSRTMTPADPTHYPWIIVSFDI